MSLLFRSQLRFVRHAPWSAATALLGVALGVASVVAVHLISAAVVRSLDEGAPAHLAGLTHVLERPALDADDYFTLRAAWRAAPHAPITALVPMVEGHRLVDGRQTLVLGVDWLAMPSPPVDATRRASDDQSSAVSTDVLLGEAVLADRAFGRSAGEHVDVAGRRFRIESVLEAGLGAALITDIAAAQHLLGVGPQTLSRVGLTLDDPWQPWRERLDRLMPGFAAGLPRPREDSLTALVPGLRVPQADEWRARPVAAERPEAEFARAVLFNLGSLGTLALLVAWFLIYQIGLIWLRRQRLLLERLHAVGVDHGALRQSFLAVFLTLGALATVLGLAAGFAFARLLVALTGEGLEEAGSFGIARTLPDVWLLAKALGSGLGVCLLGGLAAFAREWQERSWSPGWRLLAPGLLVVLALGLWLESTGVLGGFVAILAMSLLVVALVTPLLGLLRRWVSAARGPLALRLALRDVAWYPRLLGVALAALSLAVATSIGIGLMVESFRLDFERMLDVRLSGDLYLDAAAADPAALQRWLAAQPEVARQQAYGATRSRIAGVPVELGYTRFDAAESARYRHPRPLGADEALISERLARDLGAAAGEVLQLAGGTLKVAGTFPGFGDPLGRVLVDLAALERLEVPAAFDRITVHLVRPAAAEALAARVRERFPAVRIEPRADLRAEVLRVFDRTFAITRALTLVALLVAVVGTYNALTALRLQQAPTTYLLRAQGMSTRELRQIALVRAGSVGGLAMLLALPLGLAMAWTLCAVINPRSFGWSIELHLPVAAWLLPLVLGLAAALIAGALPAPRERGTLHEAA